MRISDLELNESAVITKMELPKEHVARLLQVGIDIGTNIQLIKKAPLKDPLLLQVQDTWIAIRLADAKHIIVERISP